MTMIFSNFRAAVTFLSFFLCVADKERTLMPKSIKEVKPIVVTEQ
jgi:hypothetical protein